MNQETFTAIYTPDWLQSMYYVVSINGAFFNMDPCVEKLLRRVCVDLDIGINTPSGSAFTQLDRLDTLHICRSIGVFIHYLRKFYDLEYDDLARDASYKISYAVMSLEGNT